MAAFSAALLLVGCDGDDIRAGCPVLKKYPQELLNRAAVELNALPRDSAILALVKDYKGLRDACRTE